MFKGTYTYSIDSKGRIAIPAKLRKHFKPDASDSVIVLQGTSPCIEIYPLDQWQTIEERLNQLNQFNPQDSRFTRMFLRNVEELTLDAQSRILLPQNLIKYAKIEKEVLILGILKKIEIWNPKIFDDYLNETPDTYEEMAAKVMV